MPTLTSPRYLFGAGVADFAVAPPSRHGGFYTAAPSLGNGTLWSAETGGTQYTDLQTVNGGATSSVATDQEGSLVPFYGPPGIDGAWLDFDGGGRAFVSASVSHDAHVAQLLTDESSASSAALIAAGDPRWSEVGAANARLVEDWSRRRGGIKYTNGRAAVALRFDHGLTNLKAIIRPLLVARGFPFSVAMNPSNWALVENAGATMADVQSWVDLDKCEIWNHGGNHADATTPEALYAQLVTSLETLRSQIPNAQIDGFVLPGVGGTQFLGFTGANPEVFTQTLAGRLLLKSHAVITGSMGSARRVIDGQVRQGLAHYTMDSATFASVKGQIDLAITERSGLQLFLHPSQLNASGKMTTATLTQVLDYIKTKVDAKDLVILGPYDLMLASSVGGPPAITTRTNSAPADASLVAGEMAVWLDSTNGAAKLMIKAKQADGTVKTGSVNLA